MTSSNVAKGTDRLFNLYLLFFPYSLFHTALVDFTGLGANLFHSAAEPGGGGQKSLSWKENNLYSPKNVSSSLVWSAPLAKDEPPP